MSNSHKNTKLELSGIDTRIDESQTRRTISVDLITNALMDAFKEIADNEQIEVYLGQLFEHPYRHGDVTPTQAWNRAASKNPGSIPATDSDWIKYHPVIVMILEDADFYYKCRGTLLTYLANNKAMEITKKIYSDPFYATREQSFHIADDLLAYIKALSGLTRFAMAAQEEFSQDVKDSENDYWR